VLAIGVNNPVAGYLLGRNDRRKLVPIPPAVAILFTNPTVPRNGAESRQGLRVAKQLSQTPPQLTYFPLRKGLLGCLGTINKTSRFTNFRLSAETTAEDQTEHVTLFPFDGGAASSHKETSYGRAAAVRASSV